MAHGYLEEGYGTHGEIDPDRNDERERSRERDWRTRFGDRERHAREYGSGHQGDYAASRHTPSANPDEHYRRWRDRHMSEMDREYEQYCREREEQFQREFSEWRRQRRGNPPPLRTGMAQTGLSADPSGMRQAASETAPTSPAEPDPMATATLGSQSGGRGRP